MIEEFIIETNGLKKTFVSKVKGRKIETEEVRGIDLTVKKGEIFGFLGPNGAGKSTTQKMLSTLLSPTSGEARVAGGFAAIPLHPGQWKPMSLPHLI